MTREEGLAHFAERAKAWNLYFEYYNKNHAPAPMIVTHGDESELIPLRELFNGEIHASDTSTGYTGLYCLKLTELDAIKLAKELVKRPDFRTCGKFDYAMSMLTEWIRHENHRN